MIQYDNFKADEMILENSPKKYLSCKTIPYFRFLSISKKTHKNPCHSIWIPIPDLYAH